MTGRDAPAAAAAAVDGDRLRGDVEANAEFGRLGTDDPEERGRTVLCGTEPNRRARERLIGRLHDAGLDVRVDAVGNVAGRWTPPGADAGAAPVASGSHLDSVPAGGIFDGPLGVYAALEAVRAMADAGVAPARPVEVVSFTEEEGGRFAAGLLGSSVAAGKRSVDDALALRAGTLPGEGEGEGETPETLADALDAIGARGESRLDAAGWDAWLELHVEQHTTLERAGRPVGVVTDVTGITHCDVTVTGAADHAGTTPMGERTDAFAAASEVVLDVERAARERAERDAAAVGTVGAASVAPGATNVVPGRVELGVDVRSVEAASIERIVDRLDESLARVAAERGVGTRLDREFDLAPTPTSPRIRERAERAADAAGIGTLELHSGAAHDTMHVADVTDAGMLFAPSRDGVSHSPREWTDWADCADATRVLAGTLAGLAGVGE